MASNTIRRLFFTPPIALARVGASSSPMEAFDWGPGDSRTIGETRLKPAWSLDVDTHGSVTAWLPKELRVRDGALHRPVAPFVELWALTGDGASSQWEPAPVTPDLLAANGVGDSDVRFAVTAMNLKAARRTGNPHLRYGTFPPVSLTAADHEMIPIRGLSPPEASTPMIPPGRPIPLGSIQVLRPQPQPPTDMVPAAVRLDVLRLRFTPAHGLFYGPPQAADTTLADGRAVPIERAFLNPDAGWMNASFVRADGQVQTAIVSPLDTYDMFERDDAGVSLGVVDDTCEILLEAVLTTASTDLAAHATVMVGPPHFAPDRRPFLSLADEINDREVEGSRDATMSPADRDSWVEDLFERTYETASLLDLDFWRRARGTQLPPAQQRPAKLPDDDGVEPAQQSMGGLDPLRDPDIAIAAPHPGQPFPLSARARERHRALSDIAQLKSWVLQHPERLDTLIRAPFATSALDTRGQSTMQMPPFMRNSNAFPLTLADWQYRLLMEWKADLLAGGEVALGALDDAGPQLSGTTATRRREILDLLAEDTE